MQILEINYDYFEVDLPPKGNHSNHERKAKPPREGEGYDVSWPDTWTGRKSPNALEGCTNILC